MDAVLATPALLPATSRHGRSAVTRAVRRTLADHRSSGSPGSHDDVVDDVLHALRDGAPPLRPVLNATGVVIHTGLGRAPLSGTARAALLDAAGHTPVEFSLTTGARHRRGDAVLQALTDAVPGAESAHVVTNGAAALLLAATALASGREIVVSRGQLVQIGDGFRLPELLTTTGARLREVGTTNRTSPADYADAVGAATGAALIVHPSNFWVGGFAGTPDVRDVVAAVRAVREDVPVVVDIGSGLLTRRSTLPEEPDAASVLAAGADLVTASGDKLLGGPQSGLILGRRDLVERLRRHTLARALRVDKLTLAALGTVADDPTDTPVHRALTARPDELEQACRALADGVGAGAVVAHDGVVGGGGAPGHRLPGFALALPAWVGARLRHGEPPVVARVVDGRTLVDPRCLEADERGTLLAALRAALASGPG